MPEITTSYSLIGKTLEHDVFNEHGLLLLSKGTVLTRNDISLLISHKIYMVPVLVSPDFPFSSPEPSHSVISQIEDLLKSRGAAEKYLTALEQTKELFGKVTEVYIPPLRQFTHAFFPLLDQVIKETGLFTPLYLIEGSDNYTYRHSINVGILSALIAKLLNRTTEEVILLGQAGLLHDVGKMFIPQEILMKPGRLTDDEFEIMKQHTILGAQILSRMEGTNEVIIQCALLHHERRDGSGYPQGRKGLDIPIESQIVGVADVFDAICSDRVYKSRNSPFEAAKVLWTLTCDGLLNPEIVNRFINYIATLYVGSNALLNTGEEVEVILIHMDEPMRPLVRRGDEYLDLRKHRSLSIEKMIG
ncbi:HD-GYP domain-containing protein [Brevibacillus sp. SYP-B805]|uniref:HD-GYP domain-containing protein n=1 Tax=Brevibacillus sp. SYP-B805 TaxID=1578199 RepID=UPI0013ECE935|nr:HD-GYP domain-containing protein [Brevibacillus sp. SYP-B805]NGQ95663.1 HD-GYP domain-containing protein [Brevibacillus sp. SYP-B805]